MRAQAPIPPPRGSSFASSVHVSRDLGDRDSLSSQGSVRSPSPTLSPLLRNQYQRRSMDRRAMENISNTNGSKASSANERDRKIPAPVRVPMATDARTQQFASFDMDLFNRAKKFASERT